MGANYLNDTNILIYYLKGDIPRRALKQIGFLSNEHFNISIITKMEFLGWRGFSDQLYSQATEFINRANVIGLTNEIAGITIDLCRHNTIKLPDAIIAATCIANDMILVTRNTSDFSAITQIKTFNPFTEIK